MAGHVGGLRLVIVHSHFRPGGVRRVIELALPYLVAELRPRVDQVVLVAGENPPADWLENLRRSLADVKVSCRREAALGYWSEHRLPPATATRRIRTFLAQVFTPAAPVVVWAHNIGLGRNLLLAKGLGEVAAARKIPLVLHHHDWWFDNRWARWPEMRRAGFRSVTAVARTILPAEGAVRHAGINRSDVQVLRRHFGKRAGWLPNLAAAAARPSVARTRQARRWLQENLGDDGPVWLMPCRLLRRKNVAEALLLARWLRPEAWLVSTGGVSSADEQAYADTLERAARDHGWRMRLGVLARGEVGKPQVNELVAASEAVLLTSLQEGFGLPNLEAVAAGRPLIARTLPNIAPDLARFGFRFPHTYDEVRVDTRLFDRAAERKRQEQRWRAWRAALPSTYHRWAARPPLLESREGAPAVAFSRLTLTAQLEVLAHPPAESWELCRGLNPFLGRWRGLAAKGALRTSRWPDQAGRWLDGRAYAGRLARLFKPAGQERTNPDAGVRALAEFVRLKLASENQYPLLWTSKP